MTTATTTSSVLADPHAFADIQGTRFWQRFLRNRLGVISGVVVLLFFGLALVSGLCALGGVYFPCNPNTTHIEQKLLPPSAAHWFGTDNLGRDVGARLISGSYISLSVGFIAVFVSLTIGILVGAVSGYFGGWVDNVLMRVVDAILCFPTFFIILTVVAVLGPHIINIVAVIGLVSWTGTARLVRAEFLTLRETEYVRAARTLGARASSIIFHHILPNAAAPIIVTAVIGIPDAILTEAGLSFLGFGVQLPQATWGNIISDGKTYLLDAWWLNVFPGAAIFISCLSLYLLGDAFRQASSTRSDKN